MTKKFTWTDANVTALNSAVEGVELITQDQLHTIAGDLGTTARSVGSKLRKLGFEVQKAADANRSAWSEDEQEALVDFLSANDGALTYAEIAAALLAGKFTTKQVQGKILSLELTGKVKPTEKAVAVRTYSAEEEAQIVALVADGASMEAVAEALDKKIESVRGKCLSLQKEGRIESMPKQAKSAAKPKSDILAGLEVAEMTIAQIAEATDRTERGIKSLLTRRGVDCADHKGAEKAAKIAEKKEA